MTAWAAPSTVTVPSTRIDCSNRLAGYRSLPTSLLVLVPNRSLVGAASSAIESGTNAPASGPVIVRTMPSNVNTAGAAGCHPKWRPHWS